MASHIVYFEADYGGDLPTLQAFKTYLDGLAIDAENIGIPKNKKLENTVIKQYVPEIDDISWNENLTTPFFTGELTINTDHYDPSIIWVFSSHEGKLTTALSIVGMILDRLLCVPVGWPGIVGEYEIRVTKIGPIGPGGTGGMQAHP